MNSSANTIIGYAWNVLKVDGSTIAAPGLQSSMMLTVLNWANAEWQRTFTRSAGQPPEYFEREKGFDLIPSTTLSAAQATSDVTASLTSSSNFPTSGAIVIYDDTDPDIQEHTGNSANVLTGVTGNDWAHEAGDQVIKLYALPANFGSFRSQEGYGDGVRIGGQGYYYTNHDPQGFEFSKYDNGTTTYLWLPPDVSGSAQVLYNKKSTTLDDTTDTVDVPVEYEQFLVYRLVAHGRRVRGDNADKAQEAELQANEILLQAQKEKSIRQGVIARPIQPRRGPFLYRTNLRDE